MSIRTSVAIFALALITAPAGPARSNDVTHFESPSVHPVELSPNRNKLFVVHTADHRLVVFDLNMSPPGKIAEIMVGLEPVSVRARNAGEVWVVNHVSDSINIIDVAAGHVVRTLLVGDEPTDVVFSGNRAFVCVSQEDLIRVYDLADLSAPPIDIPLAMSDPRSLALSPDGGTVYVCAMDGQNRTSIVPAATVEANGGLPEPNPPMNPNLPAPPNVSLIVKHNGAHWVDETARSWDAFLPYTLLDNDVIAVNTTSLAVTASYQGLGTTLFNIAVHPGGSLFVTNQEAFNEVRFEPNVVGKFAQNRVTIVAPGGSVTARHLNDHIDYNAPAGNAGERAASICIPLDIAVSADGNEVFVAGFGSRKVAVLDAAGTVTRRITVGEGPAGLAIDEARNRLYVLNRFESTLSVVDLDADVAQEVPLGFDPSPPFVREGRKFLYDGESSSAHGDLACASCHLFAGMDNIAWDLGDPTASSMIPVPPGQLPLLPPFHPMKGPMTTQALKGMDGTGPFHWRGDRAGFADFNGAFVSLMGRSSTLSGAEMGMFEDFVFSIAYPPNPFRDLDGTLPTFLNGADPLHGEQLFLSGGLVGSLECASCHVLPTGENGTIISGTLLDEDEGKVVPQLRNMYEKTRFDQAAATNVRGFGFIHDGAVDNLFNFLGFRAFTFENDDDKRDVEAFLLAFNSETPPGVGAQWTMDGSNQAAGLVRLNTLQSLADFNTIGLVAKGKVAGQPRGWMYVGGGSWRPDKQAESDVSQLALLSLAGQGGELTFTGVVEGGENRLGIDRDLDGFRDGDEVDAGSDPGDPNSTPDNAPTGITRRDRGAPPLLYIAGANPTSTHALLALRLEGDSPVRIEVYNVRGARVRRLVDEPRTRGTYTETWDLRSDRGEPVSSGIYFVRMETPGSVIARRVTIVR